ncbi:MAG: hypothetical protein ACFFAO_06395 [Candidatus Hermodarchaeota archaeon]
MGRYSGKYKGKRGKVDFVEDIIGTEPLAGTYEERAKVAKMLEQEKLLIQDCERKFMEKIRKEREKELLKKLTDKDKWIDICRKIEWLLPYVAEKTTFEYLKQLQEKEPEICQEIMKYLFHPSDIKNLDAYIERIIQIGHGPKNKIKLERVIKIERSIKKIKPKIQIEENGKRIDIGEKITGRKIA